MRAIDSIKNTCKLTALASFSIGTILVILFAISNSDWLIQIGFYYIGIAFFINLILLFLVFVAALYYSKYRMELLSHCGLLLLNIPVAIGYFFVILNIAVI